MTMPHPHSDALVFFGATGDLAYKKIFPSLQAMVKRGHLNVPVIGVAKAGWNLDQLRARARDSLEHHGGLDTAAFDKLSQLAALCGWRLPRSGHVSGHPPGAGLGAATGALSRHPAHAVRAGGGTAGQGGLHQRCSCHHRKALRSRPRLGAGPQPHPAVHVRRAGHLPHRPLPGQAAGAQHALLPLRQRAPGAVLEPQPCRECADHHGGRLRSPGPGCFL